MATVLDITANANALTTIGKVGENQYKRILFPIANWLALYPGATCELVHRRATDGGGYPVLNITTDANYLYWTVESGDCAVAGIGAAEVIIKSGDSIAKSVIYPTQVLPSVVDTEVPPTPWEDYISRIYDSAVDIDANIQAAEDAAEAAEKAQQAIENLGVAANAATGSTPTVTKTVNAQTGQVTLTFGLISGKPGIIQNGTWWTYDETAGAYVDTGIPSSGVELVRLL